MGSQIPRVNQVFYVRKINKVGIQKVVLIVLSVIVALSWSPAVYAIKCYNCTYSAIDVAGSDPGCEHSVPPSDLLVKFGPEVNGPSLDYGTNPQYSFCSMITIKSNGSTQSIYRNGYTFDNHEEEELGLPQQCLDLLSNPTQNRNTQAYIQDRWNITLKNNTTNYESGPKDCEGGTMHAEIITIFACFCNNDNGCNGANLDFDENNERNNNNNVRKPATITARTCFPRLKRIEQAKNSVQGIYNAPSATGFDKFYYLVGFLTAGLLWETAVNIVG